MHNTVLKNTVFNYWIVLKIMLIEDDVCPCYDAVVTGIGEHGKHTNSLHPRGRGYGYDTIREAKKRLRSYCSNKLSSGEWERVEIVPPEVERFLAPNPEDQISPLKLEKMVQEKKRERYVVLWDVTGIEDFFDPGVEYLALADPADPVGEKTTVTVYDKFGECREILHDRIQKISLTEDSVQVVDKNETKPVEKQNASLILFGGLCPRSLCVETVSAQMCWTCKYCEGIAPKSKGVWCKRTNVET